jgi:predicted GTPase
MGREDREGGDRMSREDKSVHVIITGSRNAGISSFISQMENDREKVDEIGMGIDIQTTSVFFNDTEIFAIFSLILLHHASHVVNSFLE